MHHLWVREAGVVRLGSRGKVAYSHRTVCATPGGREGGVVLEVWPPGATCISRSENCRRTRLSECIEAVACSRERPHVSSRRCPHTECCLSVAHTLQRVQGTHRTAQRERERRSTAQHTQSRARVLYAPHVGRGGVIENTPPRFPLSRFRIIDYGFILTERQHLTGSHRF